MNKWKLFFLLNCTSIYLAFANNSDSLRRNEERATSTKIWATAEHSAFTDLIRFKDAFYCTFREGSDHARGEDGKVRVIRSTDGKNWKSVTLLEVKGLDLRDPKLSITPQGKLMVIMGGSVYQNRKMLERIPQVSFSDVDGNTFTKPQPIKLDPEMKNSWDWVWRVSWHKGVGYAINWKYEHNGGESRATGQIYLVKTTDGISYEKMYYFDIEGYPNESTVRFDENDKMYVLVRRERGVGLLAVSEKPSYNNFKIHELPFRIGGPNFLHMANNKLIIGCGYHNNVWEHDRRTSIHAGDRYGNIYKSIFLPSGGDNSYPGLVIHDKELWVSYYSSHEGKSSIYLSRIPLENLE